MYAIRSYYATHTLTQLHNVSAMDTHQAQHAQPITQKLFAQTILRDGDVTATLIQLSNVQMRDTEPQPARQATLKPIA